jgi:hypothetical protein
LDTDNEGNLDIKKSIHFLKSFFSQFGVSSEHPRGGVYGECGYGEYERCDDVEEIPHLVRVLELVVRCLPAQEQQQLAEQVQAVDYHDEKEDGGDVKDGIGLIGREIVKYSE